MATANDNLRNGGTGAAECGRAIARLSYHHTAVRLRNQLKIAGFFFGVLERSCRVFMIQAMQDVSYKPCSTAYPLSGVLLFTFSLVTKHDIIFFVLEFPQ